MIITRTPLRISLCGGGTDMPEFYKKHPGAVISFTINKYVYVSVNEKFDGNLRLSYSKTENVESSWQLKHDLARETLKAFGLRRGLEITSVSDIPGEGSGLGSSSAFTVGLINALAKDPLDKFVLAERAYRIEREKCGHPVGKQDQYASAFGGVNLISFFSDGAVSVRKAVCDIEKLNSCMLLLWTGRTRNANEILSRQGNLLSHNQSLGVELHHIAHQIYSKISWIEPKDLGAYLHTAWDIKRRMANGISNEYIGNIYQIGLNNGAYGGKICGAGGGGFMLFVADPDSHDRIARATGLRRVPFKITSKGSEVVHGDKN